MTSVRVLAEAAEDSDRTVDLLALLGWVRRHRPEVALHISLLRGGPLIHRFHAIGPTTVIDWYDRRDDRRGAAAVSRNPRTRRCLEALIDRLGRATLARRLPRPAIDVEVIAGLPALTGRPSGWGRLRGAVVLLLDHDDDPTPVPRPSARRLARAGAVIVADPASARDLAGAGVAEERIVVLEGSERIEMGSTRSGAERIWSEVERCVSG